MATTVALAILYGPWHVFRPEDQYFMSDAENIFYGTFHRFSFALCVAWVIYYCHNKMGSKYFIGNNCLLFVTL